jgi:chromosome segregation ATPase
VITRIYLPSLPILFRPIPTQNRILKDMERNAPLLLGQKRDLNRVLESHAHLTARLDEVGTENTKLREERKAALESVRTLQQDAAALTQHNSDLSRQVQHLLKRSLDGQGQRPQVALIGKISLSFDFCSVSCLSFLVMTASLPLKSTLSFE